MAAGTPRSEAQVRHTARRTARPARGRAARAIVGLAAAALAMWAAAQGSYPDRPVKLLVPLAAGGGGDIVARLVAKVLAPALGQPVFVENKPGANGIVGAQAGAAAAPDGYTIMLGSLGTHAVNESLYSKLPYNPARDFIPVTMIALYDNVVVVPAASPVKTVDELVQLAKRKPGELNYGITVLGNSAHLAAEQFKHAAGINVVGVPYDSSAKAAIDLLGGRLDYLFDTVLTQAGPIREGKVRALGTTSLKRSPDLPNVPTLTEQGYAVNSVGWLGLFVQAGTPKPVIDRIFAAMQKAWESPDIRASKSAGIDLTLSGSPQEFADYVAQERVTWARVIKQSQIKID
jgi:tripartite-type tricarboxylate transporter receptor subunit TctC